MMLKGPVEQQLLASAAVLPDISSILDVSLCAVLDLDVQHLWIRKRPLRSMPCSFPPTCAAAKRAKSGSCVKDVAVLHMRCH